MQIRPASVRLVQLNFGLSMYLDRTFRLSLSLSRNFGLRPKFRLSDRLSEITSLFDLSLVLDRTLAQRKAQRKAKSKSEVAHCIYSVSHVRTYYRPSYSNQPLATLRVSIVASRMIGLWEHCVMLRSSFVWQRSTSLSSCCCSRTIASSSKTT